MHPELAELRPIVTAAARAELLPRFAKVSECPKTNGSVLTEADLAMQQRLHRLFTSLWPAIEFLAEEQPEAEQVQQVAAAAQGLWCIDPLDGTSNFVAGLPFFSTSVALVVNGEVILGLVYDPIRDECFSAAKGQGAWLNDEPLTAPSAYPVLSNSLALIDFKRLPPELAMRLVWQPPYRSQRSLGSSALDWCWIAADRCNVYLHGRQMLWDYAAGSLILQEAGGQAATLAGEAVLSPSLKPRSVAAALGSELFAEWLAWLGIVRP